MKKRFFPAIRAGTKTTTLRYWLRPQVRPDTVRTVPGLGKVRIDAVHPVDPRQLTDEDARADGFDGLGALKRALRGLYPPPRRAGRRLYKVCFTYVPAG